VIVSRIFINKNHYFLTITVWWFVGELAA